MPKKRQSKVAAAHFVLQFPEDEEAINCVVVDPDCSGFQVRWLSATVGMFLDVPEEETELLVVWYAGTLGVRFAALVFEGQDLLKNHAKEIKKEIAWERSLLKRTEIAWERSLLKRTR